MKSGESSPFDIGRFFIILLGSFSGAVWACDVCLTGCTYYSIQAAITAASPGGTIQVCPGTYTELIDYAGKALTVVSRDGPETTVIDGGRLGSVVTFNSGEGAGSVLDGFTLTNGSGTTAGLSYGGGVYCSDAAPSIRNSHITGNDASYGGGLYLNDCDANIEACYIHRNMAATYDGAGVYADSSSPTISNSRFEYNAALRHGGGIYAKSSTLTVNASVLDSNAAQIFPSGKGGGIYLEDSDLNLDASVLMDNAADDHGGGLYGDSGSQARISGSTFTGNRVDDSGGGAYLNSGAPVISNSVFNGNESGLDGAGLFLNQTAGSISDTLFIRNRTERNGSGGGIVFLMAGTSVNKANVTENSAGVAGGGIWTYNSASPVISDSIISFNTAGSDGAGVMVTEFSTPTFVNSVFHNNFLTGILPGFGTGGGMAVYQSSPVTLTNCTLRYNAATVRGGGLYNEFADVTVKNSIVWGNTPDQIGSFGSGGAPAVTYSDVQGGYAGTGNIAETPRFINLFNAHLKEDSPAIDSADPLGAPAMDIDGDVRPLAGGVDMGADEYAGAALPLPDILANGIGGAVSVDSSVTPDVVFTFGLDNSGRTDDADWWVVFSTPSATLFLTPTGLTTDWTPYLQYPLEPVTGYDYPAIPLAGVAPGAYTVHFGVDTRQDGILTWNDLYYDWVTVNLTD